MKALVFQGTEDVSVEEVPDPKIIEPTDIILKVTTAAICGSDSHLYGGFIPTTEPGDILGHEFMGEVAEVGGEVKNLKVGDRVVIPFPISCGFCYYCKKGLWSLCDTTNANNKKAELLFGYPPAGIYGYSHLFGGYSGGQAEFVRVPFADVNHFKVPAGLSDETVLFMGDIFPTGYMAAENCNIQPDQTIAVWGCGPVGQFAIRSAKILGAKRVIAVDSHPERLAMAEAGGAETINDEEHKGTEVFKKLKEMTNNAGPDAVIDAVGLEAHGTGVMPNIMGAIDTIKQTIMPGVDRGNALREVIYACRKGGIVSIAGAYGGMLDNFPMGIAFNKGLTFRMGQTHVHRYYQTMLDLIEKGVIDPAFVVTHRLPLAEAAEGYKMFRDRDDKCIKVVLKP
jgi:threonine dehydrogenase-like Zn-dependent dehydrogenase